MKLDQNRLMSEHLYWAAHAPSAATHFSSRYGRIDFFSLDDRCAFRLCAGHRWSKCVPPLDLIPRPTTPTEKHYAATYDS